MFPGSAELMSMNKAVQTSSPVSPPFYEKAVLEHLLCVGLPVSPPLWLCQLVGWSRAERWSSLAYSSVDPLITTLSTALAQEHRFLCEVSSTLRDIAVPP